jgi:hypothetical protein
VAATVVRAAGRIKLIAGLYLAYGIFSCMIAPVFFFAMRAAIADGRFAGLSPGAPYLVAPATLVLGVGALCAGFGLLRHTDWGRPIAIAMALAALPMFLFGTLFGAFALWALSTDPARPPAAG